MKKFRIWAGIPGGPEGSDSGAVHSEQSGYVDNVSIFPGYSSPAIAVTVPGAQSYQCDPSPVTIARFNMSRGVHDVQLSNGWQRTNYGKVTTYAGSGYLSGIVPTIPGQSRLYGQYGPPQGFTPQTQSAIAPSGWQNIVATAQAASVNTVSGPGTLGGPMGYMGQAGG